MCTHLSKRGSTYYFRRRVLPESLIQFVGKREWLISLRTKDRNVAKRLIPDLTKATDAELDRAREAQAAVTPPAAPDHAPAGSPGRRWAIPIEQVEADEILAQESAEQEFRREARAAEVERLARRLKLPTRELPETEAAMADLLRAERERREEAEQRAAMAEARAKVAKAKRDTPVPTAAEPALEGEPVPIVGLLDGYAAEARTLRPLTVANWQVHLRKFKEFLGHDDARLVTPEDVIRFKDDRLSAKGRNGRLMKPKTVEDGYLTTLRAVFGWAAKNRKISSNPAHGISLVVRKEPKLRERGFTDAEAVTVLAATLKPAIDRLQPEYALALRWVPWLCAYTGARVGEIAQLRAEDVLEIDGIWAIHITPEAGSVKTNEARLVPLHSHLVAMGFPAVAKRTETGPLFYSPARRKVAEGAKPLSQKVGEKISAMVRAAGIGPDTVEQPSHAWRHRFKTESRRWDMDSGAADRLQGHAPSNEGGKYGGWPMERWQREIEKLPRYKVPGF